MDKVAKSKVAVIYFSGVGNTRRIATAIHQKLGKILSADLYSVEEAEILNTVDLDCYDGVVIGFPIVHTHPSKIILDYIHEIDRLSAPKAAYIFSTCGLYSANALRIFSKHCSSKNVISVMYRDYRGCPATDGALLAPFVKGFFTFPKNLDKFIEEDVNRFAAIVEGGLLELKTPRFKFYSILNYPNKLAGQLISFPIFLHRQNCKKCGKCIINCPVGAYIKDEEGFPLFSITKCAKCYRCIHHCPNLALSLSRRKLPKKVLVFKGDDDSCSLPSSDND